MQRWLISILLVGASHIAAGCSYDLRTYNSVEKRYTESRVVALAEVVSSTREKFDYLNGAKGTREVVEFRVLEVWKGSAKLGTKVVTTTDIKDSCGLNVLNSPPILESPDGPVELGKLWLLYLSGDPPYQLSQIPGSKPLVIAAADLPELYRITFEHRAKAKSTSANPDKSLEQTRDR